MPGQVGPNVGGGGSLIVTQSTVVLSNAQVIALPTTPVTVLPAPGAKRVIIPIFATLHLANWVADYGDIDVGATVNLTLAGVSVFSPVDNAVASEVGNLLAGGGPDGTFTFMGPTQRASGATTNAIGGFYESDIVNKPLTISMSNGQVLSGGNAAQSLIVTVLYYILSY